MNMGLMHEHVNDDETLVTCCCRRGLGGGFSDDNSKPFFSAVLTIKHQKPKVWLLECVDAVDSRSTSNTSGSDLEVIRKKLEEHLDQDFVFALLQNRSPTLYGYPMLRPRFYCIGIRGYPRSKEDLTDELMNMSNTLGHHLAPGPDFITFLNLGSENLSLKYRSQHDMIM